MASGAVAESQMERLISDNVKLLNKVVQLKQQVIYTNMQITSFGVCLVNETVLFSTVLTSNMALLYISGRPLFFQPFFAVQLLAGSYFSSQETSGITCKRVQFVVL